MLTAAQRVIARTCPSYRDFVDAALFAPGWGYYSSGAIRFGEGGHYDTYPLALSPYFGRIVAARARRQWERCGKPARFDVCELGAGNGQLCLDTLVAVAAKAGRHAAWRAFDAALRYCIVERSAALVERQRAQLGAMQGRVTWTCTDLSTAAPAAVQGDAALVVANEVLDCLSHHKLVRPAGGPAAVAFVIPSLDGHRLSARALHAAMRDPARRDRVAFREVALPLAAVPGLAAFCSTWLPQLGASAAERPPYFACPEMPALIANVGALYRRAEYLWIDYGDTRRFHLRAPESKKVFAGPPHSGHRVYDAPGRDDVTFMVDFTLARDAAEAAGMRTVWYGPQADLLRGTGIRLGASAVGEILRYRAVGWLLAMTGRDPERAWRQGSMTWSGTAAKGGALRQSVARDVDTFLGRRRSPFRVLVLHKP